MSSPGVCWQLVPWWEVWLEMDGLELEPGVSQGFSWAQQKSPLWFGAWPGPKGLELLYWTGFAPSFVHVCTPAMAVSALTRQQGWGPSWFHSFSDACTHIGYGSLLLSGKQFWSRRGCSRRPVWAGGHVGLSWQDGQSMRQFSICCLCAKSGSKQVCACVHWERSLGFSQPSVKPHWYSNQLRWFVFLVLDPTAGLPNILLEPITPQRGSPSLWYPPPLVSHLLGVWVLTKSPLLPPYHTPYGSFFTAWL